MCPVSRKIFGIDRGRGGFGGAVNHLEQILLDQVPVQALYTPPFWGFFA